MFSRATRAGLDSRAEWAEPNLLDHRRACEICEIWRPRSGVRGCIPAFHSSIPAQPISDTPPRSSRRIRGHRNRAPARSKATPSQWKATIHRRTPEPQSAAATLQCGDASPLSILPFQTPRRTAVPASPLSLRGEGQGEGRTSRPTPRRTAVPESPLSPAGERVRERGTSASQPVRRIAAPTSPLSPRGRGLGRGAHQTASQAAESPSLQVPSPRGERVRERGAPAAPQNDCDRQFRKNRHNPDIRLNCYDPTGRYREWVGLALMDLRETTTTQRPSLHTTVTRPQRIENEL